MIEPSRAAIQERRFIPSFRIFVYSAKARKYRGIARFKG